MPHMSFFDLVCNECGYHAKVAEQGNAGLKFPCAGCGTILQAPGNKPPEVPEGGKHTVRVLPPYIPKHAERPTSTSNRECGSLEIDGHIYTLQCGPEQVKTVLEEIRKSIANGTFRGFGRATPLPEPAPGINRLLSRWQLSNATAKQLRQRFDALLTELGARQVSRREYDFELDTPLGLLWIGRPTYDFGFIMARFAEPRRTNRKLATPCKKPSGNWNWQPGNGTPAEMIEAFEANLRQLMAIPRT